MGVTPSIEGVIEHLFSANEDQYVLMRAHIHNLNMYRGGLATSPDGWS